MVQPLFHRRSLAALAFLLMSCGGIRAGTDAVVQGTSSGSVPASASGSALFIETSGTKAGAYSTLLVNEPSKRIGAERPAASLGIFTNLYLTQGAFVPVRAANMGIEAQQLILIGQSTPESSETFALLKEFGAVLQADIVDILNRSIDREEALDRYLRSLENITTLARRKITELTALQEDLDARLKEQRGAVRELERSVQKAIKEENYEFASEHQEELVSSKASLAELETQLSQTKDILKPYEKLMSVAEERYDAITKNRRVLLAGLKVVEVPGIENLDLIEQNTAKTKEPAVIPGLAE